MSQPFQQKTKREKEKQWKYMYTQKISILAYPGGVLSLLASCYRPSVIVTVTWFTLHDLSCLLDESFSKRFLPKQKPGCFGWANEAFSLLSINTTVDMDGLSSACSCAHNSPKCMVRAISYGEYKSLTAGSISSSPLPSLHSLHVCASIISVHFYHQMKKWKVPTLTYPRRLRSWSAL